MTSGQCARTAPNLPPGGACRPRFLSYTRARWLAGWLAQWNSLALSNTQFMGNFNSWENSNMVWAFARMNYTPGEEWLNQFVYWCVGHGAGTRMCNIP